MWYSDFTLRSGSGLVILEYWIERVSKNRFVSNVYS